MGGLAFDAIMERDYPIVMGVVLLVAVLFIFINLLVDLSYTFFDPRISYDTKTS
jgi:peptide/nickel transport system permease protein